MKRILRLVSMLVMLALVGQLLSSTALAGSSQGVQTANVWMQSDLRVDRVSTPQAKNVYFVSYRSGQLSVPDVTAPKSAAGASDKATDIKDKDFTTQQDQLIKQAKTQTPEGRIYFQIFPSEKEAVAFAQGLVKKSGVEAQWRKGIGFGSYIETYGNAFGGFHLHLSSRDAQFLMTLGGTGAGALTAWLATVGAITAGAAIAIGTIVAVAIAAVYWREQNNDQSFDAWIPYLSLIAPTGLRRVLAGSHWYAF